MTKLPYHQKIKKKAHKLHQELQRLQTDLEWPVRITTAIQLVWLQPFTGAQTSH